MARSGADVKLYVDHIKLVIKDANAEVMKRAALRIQERARANIRENDQIDTGFMVNSIYAVFEGGDTYNQANQTGSYTNEAGQSVDRVLAPAQGLQDGAAAGVVVGANYAIYQEAAQPFLYPAAEAAAGEFGGEAERIYKEMLPDEGPSA